MSGCHPFNAYFLFISFFFCWSTLCWKCGGRTWCGERCSCSLAHRWPSLDQLMLFFQLFLPFSLLNPFLFLLHQACSYPVYSPVLCIHQFLPRLYVEEKIHEKVVRQRYDLVHIFCIPTPPLIASWFMYLTAKYTTKFLPSSCDFLFKGKSPPTHCLTVGTQIHDRAANWSNHICGRLLVTGGEELRIACQAFSGIVGMSNKARGSRAPFGRPPEARPGA